MTITLDPTIEDKLRAEAQARGVPAEEYVRELLEEHFASPVKSGGEREAQQSNSLKPLLILEGSVPRLTKDELY